MNSQSWFHGGIVTAVLVASLGGCADQGSEPVIADLDVSVLSASVGADMMPVVGPGPVDRIGCVVDLLVRNTSGSGVRAELRILKADLWRSGTRTRLGTLYFNAPWDIVLGPGEADTVHLVKRSLSEDFVQPECGAKVVLELVIGEREEYVLRTWSGELDFGCVY